MNKTVGAEGGKQGAGQSAESVVAIALLCVCAAAGLAAWLLSGDELPVITPAQNAPAKVTSVQADEELYSEEQAVLAAWQSRLDGEFSEREQSLRQQAQLLVMQQQSDALAEASAEAEARAAEVAELRALNAEKERQAALAKVREKEAAAAKKDAAAKLELASQTESASETPVALDVPASIDWSSCARPEYPDEAVRFGKQGTVTMSFLVDPEGKPSDGKIVDSSGTRRLDYRALSALSRCQFEPGQANGIAVASLAQVRFTWKLTR
tara:strand:+ start:11416 stop:12216 length:801 start_codon:yes stop_codon:yes gene_type:complete